MKKSIVTGAVLALMLGASGARATDDQECHGNGCQNVGGNLTTTTNNQGGAGGAGGAGGQGGAGYGGDAKAYGGNVNLGYGAVQGGRGGDAKAYGGDASNRNYNSDYNSNKQYQSQKQYQGNSQVTVIEDSGRADTHYSGEYKVRTTPAISLGGPASGPCNGFSGGIAGSGIGFGFAANASTLDEGCEDRETARMLHLLGDTASGLELLKTSKAYARMQERKAEMKKKAETDTETKKLADEESARRASIRKANPSSDGSWTSGAAQPIRVWTGNSEGQSVAYTSFPR